MTLQVDDPCTKICHCVARAHRLHAHQWHGTGRSLGGVFAQRAHSANHYVVYPGNTPENHPPAEGCMINLKQHGVPNSGPWDPWQASDLKKKSLVYQQGGGRVQNSGPWDPWLPVVENSRLFAQRAHSAQYAPLTGKKKVFLYTVFPKKARGHTMCWRWVVGGGRLTTGNWWRLVVVGGGWWLGIGG